MQLVDKSGQVRIPRVDLAMDAGTVISPERAGSQFEGAAVSGTSIAMLGETTAKNGQIEESNFHDYPVARIQEAPRQIHVHIVHSQEPPAGVGEPGVPPITPATCNAISAGTGQRIRDLPVQKHKLA